MPDLLQLINVLGLLQVELKDVKDTSVDVQYCGGHSSRGKDLTNHTIGVLKLDRHQELRSQG